jgi:hypothetical protein
LPSEVGCNLTCPRRRHAKSGKRRVRRALDETSRCASERDRAGTARRSAIPPRHMQTQQQQARRHICQSGAASRHESFCAGRPTRPVDARLQRRARCVRRRSMRDALPAFDTHLAADARRAAPESRPVFRPTRSRIPARVTVDRSLQSTTRGYCSRRWMQAASTPALARRHGTRGAESRQHW